MNHRTTNLFRLAPLRPVRSLALLAVAMLFAGCQQKMARQPSYQPLEAAAFFADGRSARPAVAGTVARGQLRIDKALFTGRRSGALPGTGKRERGAPTTEPEALDIGAVERRENDEFVAEFPVSITPDFIEHGYRRYMIYCVVCHDALGTGHGKIVERGYVRPPSYHKRSLREAAVGRLFAVVTEGHGPMPSYAEQISPRDRWAIVAYVRTLQLSQHFPADEVPAGLVQQWSAQQLTAPPPEKSR